MQHPRRASSDSNAGGTDRAGSTAANVVGTVALLLSAVVIVLAVIDGSAGLPFRMPTSWYTSRAIWYLAAFASFIGGCSALRRRPAARSAWAPERPGVRFNTVVFYTRAGCHLCEEAMDVLLRHARWLPVIEEVDIDGDPHLVERFGTSVPVVEIDGRVRFRCRVSEVLLRRLIEGSPPRTVARPRSLA